MVRNQTEPIIHKDCGNRMIVEVFTHNSAPGGKVTAVHYTCEACGESWRA